METKINWGNVITAVAATLSAGAIAGMLSVRDTARDAYFGLGRLQDRVASLEQGLGTAVRDSAATQAAIPLLQSDVAMLAEQQDWAAALLYDLARAIKPSLPVAPPPMRKPQSLRATEHRR